MAFYGTPYSSSCDYGFAPNPIQVYSSSYEYGEHELIEYKSSTCHKDDSFVTPSELSYSAYPYSKPEILQYEPIQYHSSYDYYGSSAYPSEINYSIYDYSEPKLLQYEPPGYFLSETKFTVSHSTVEFNEPEFEEYDSTPYGGGYDLAATYGKPLPPSDIICYPRSSPQSDIISLEHFSYASIPSPYGKDDELEKKPVNGSKPIDTKTDTKTHVENGDKVTRDGAESALQNGETAEPLDVISTVDSPVSEHENGFENGTREGYGYESERQVSQIPYGSGLETIDICESIFGYWPCLAKIEQQKRRERCQVCDRERKMDPWESAADYLFGNPLVYDYENHHHHQQLLQDKCYENSWPN